VTQHLSCSLSGYPRDRLRGAGQRACGVAVGWSRHSPRSPRPPRSPQAAALDSTALLDGGCSASPRAVCSVTRCPCTQIKPPASLRLRYPPHAFFFFFFFLCFFCMHVAYVGISDCIAITGPAFRFTKGYMGEPPTGHPGRWLTPWLVHKRVPHTILGQLVNYKSRCTGVTLHGTQAGSCNQSWDTSVYATWHPGK
jgi:hypothetical protein